MKSRLLILAAVIVVLGGGLWLITSRNAEHVDLVRVWSLTPKGMYSADQLFDPLMSWSPDSKSLLLVAKSNKTSRHWILRWHVGDRGLQKVGQGICPNYVDSDTYLYGTINPFCIIAHSFSRGTSKLVARGFKGVDFSKDITSFSYLPATRTLALRFSNFTRYYEPGLVEVDLTGKQIRRLPRVTGDGILDRSTDPGNKQAAEIVGELSGTGRVLQIRPVDAKAAGKQVAAGDLGAVAWSPDGKMIAFADLDDIKVTDPTGSRVVTVAKFPSSSTYTQLPYICRLAWSPDSKCLAAVQLLPNEVCGDMMAYVLDMSKLKL